MLDPNIATSMKFFSWKKKPKAEPSQELFGMGKPKHQPLTPEQEELMYLRDELWEVNSYINNLSDPDEFELDDDVDDWDDHGATGTTRVTPGFCKKVLAAAQAIHNKARVITDIHSVPGFRKAITHEYSFLYHMWDEIKKEKIIHITTEKFESYVDKLTKQAETYIDEVLKRLSHFHLPSNESFEAGLELFGFGNRKPNRPELTPEQSSAKVLYNEMMAINSFCDVISYPDYADYDENLYVQMDEEDLPVKTRVTPKFCKSLINAIKKIGSKASLLHDISSVSSFRDAAHTELQYLLSGYENLEKQPVINTTMAKWEQSAYEVSKESDKVMLPMIRKLESFHVPSVGKENLDISTEALFKKGPHYNELKPLIIQIKKSRKCMYWLLRVADKDLEESHNKETHKAKAKITPRFADNIGKPWKEIEAKLPNVKTVAQAKALSKVIEQLFQYCGSGAMMPNKIPVYKDAAAQPAVEANYEEARDLLRGIHRRINGIAKQAIRTLSKI